MEANSGPKPEVLTAQGESASIADNYASDTPVARQAVAKRGSYKPSHKGTFIGLAAIAGFIALNVAVVMFIMRGQSDTIQKAKSEVTLSSDTLNSLGLNKTAVGNTGAKLTIAPDSTFDGTVTVGKNVNIGGELQLNSKFTAGQANIATLQAGDTSLAKVTVNGDISADNLTVRKDITVPGTSHLNGAVTVAQLLTVNNNVNVIGSLAVGGSLSVHNFQASSLTSDTTLTIGGHVVTRGNSPTLVKGDALGSNGTATVSGSDASGGISLGIGTGAHAGLLCTVAFSQKYTSTPRVVVTAVGQPMGLYINRNESGFEVYTTNALSAGGYAVDYIVMQ